MFQVGDIVKNENDRKYEISDVVKRNSDNRIYRVKEFANGGKIVLEFLRFDGVEVSENELDSNYTLIDRVSGLPDNSGQNGRN